VAALKKDLKPIAKDSKVAFGKTNYSYFDINAMLELLNPLLEKHKLLLIQPLVSDGNIQLVRSKIIDLETGAEIVSTQKIDASGIKAQDLGSLITYFRRYTLQSLLGMRAVDDDGAKASKKKTTKVATKSTATSDDF